MALSDDLKTTVKNIFKEAWTQRDGQVVPEPEDLKLGNDAVNLEATVLYADMSGSTTLVDTQTAIFAAEIYKTYLACAARIIKDEDGTVTAYDGDRVMGVFIGKTKNTSAVRAGMKINGAVSEIIRPALTSQYPNQTYWLKHVVGVDTSKLSVSRIGVRNDNDLVWVGRAANYAAKLSSLSDEFPIYITEVVYSSMLDIAKFGGADKKNMWQKRKWTEMNDMIIYASTWLWSV
jgi:class 3 adenylate cyclase